MPSSSRFFGRKKGKGAASAGAVDERIAELPRLLPPIIAKYEPESPKEPRLIETVELVQTIVPVIEDFMNSDDYHDTMGAGAAASAAGTPSADLAKFKAMVNPSTCVTGYNLAAWKPFLESNADTKNLYDAFVLLNDVALTQEKFLQTVATIKCQEYNWAGFSAQLEIYQEQLEKLKAAVKKLQQSPKTATAFANAMPSIMKMLEIVAEFKLQLTVDERPVISTVDRVNALLELYPETDDLKDNLALYRLFDSIPGRFKGVYGSEVENPYCQHMAAIEENIARGLFNSVNTILEPGDVANAILLAEELDPYLKENYMQARKFFLDFVLKRFDDVFWQNPDAVKVERSQHSQDLLERFIKARLNDCDPQVAQHLHANPGRVIGTPTHT